jgi:hypothetical protein
MNFDRTWSRWTLGLAACALLAAGANAQCGTADVYEDNDDCLNAVVLTPGTYTGLTCQGPGDPGGDDQDYFRVTVPAGDILQVDVLHSWSATEDIDAYLYDATNPTCGDQFSFLAQGYTSTDNETMAWANSTGASVDIIIEVSAWLGGGTPVICDDYDLVIGVSPDPCQAGLDDTFEENDSCGAAVALAAGAQTGLFVSTSDEDFYKITVPAGNQVLVDQTYSSSLVELQLDLYDDPACVNLVDSYGWGGGTNQVLANNVSGVSLDYFLRVSVVDQACGAYDLNVTIQPDPCQLALDDTFEPNDDCLSAATLPAGVSTGLFVSTANEDFFKVNVAPGDQVVIDQTYVAAQAELGVDLYDDAACSNLVDTASWNGGSNQVSFGNATAAAKDFYVRAWVADGDCNNYDLSVVLQPDPCLAPGLDDSLEDNDTCGAAVVLAPGAHTGLYLATSDLDYYAISVPAGDQVTIDQTYVPGVDLFFDLFSDPSCTTYEDGAGWGGGLNSVTWANSTGGPVTLYMACDIDDFTGSCTNYDLTVTLAPDPCQDPLADDAFEDNETCATAYTISSQTYTNLFVSQADTDVYTFQLIPGGTADITLNHVAVNGDIDLLLYDDTPGVCLDGASYVTSAITGNDSEVISWSNLTGTTVTYYLHVEVWSGQSEQCNNYDMVVNLVGNQISTPTCQGDASFNAGAGIVACPCGNNSTPGANEGCLNSQGHGATIDATGSNVVANDDMVVHVAQARPGQPSMLVQGSVLTGFPFKDGILCMGTPTERIEVVFLDAAGAGSTTASIVTEGAIAGPGLTRYYQFWYRDPVITVCGTGSNFSAGICVNWL